MEAAAQSLRAESPSSLLIPMGIYRPLRTGQRFVFEVWSQNPLRFILVTIRLAVPYFNEVVYAQNPQLPAAFGTLFAAGSSQAALAPVGAYGDCMGFVVQAPPMTAQALTVRAFDTLGYFTELVIS